MPYVFDAYGTLFDFHAAIARHRAAAGPDADRFSELWRQKQIEYTWTHTLAGRYVEFWTLTQRALDYCFERFPSVDRKLARRPAQRLSQARRLPRRAHGAARIEGPRRAHRHPVQRLAGDARLGGRGGRASRADLDAVLSVDTVRMFKPRPEVYALVTKRILGASRPRWCSCHRTAGMPWAPPRSASAPSGSTAPGRRTNTPTARRRRWCRT